MQEHQKARATQKLSLTLIATAEPSLSRKWSPPLGLCGAEQQCLALMGQVQNDGIHRGLETHVHAPVRFIQDQHFHLRAVKAWRLVHVLQQPSRRGYKYIHTCMQQSCTFDMCFHVQPHVFDMLFAYAQHAPMTKNAIYQYA
jgi:hypothetical protein